MIYVDELLPCIPNTQWRHCVSCHLFADDLEELHMFAQRLGLKREWFQSQGRFLHYDITANKRRLAIKLGARPVNRNFMAQRIRAVKQAAEPEAK